MITHSLLGGQAVLKIKKERLIIHFDTGMCRLGFQEDDTIKLYKKINIIKKFNYVLIMRSFSKF